MASTFGGLQLKSKERAERRDLNIDAQKPEILRASSGDHRDQLLGPGSLGPSFKYQGPQNFPGGISNGSAEHRGILGTPFKTNGEVDHQAGTHRGPGDPWGGEGPVGDGWGADNWGGGGWDGGRGPPMNALGFVKAMIVSCLLSHSTTLPVDSASVYHRVVAKEISPVEIDALHEVGGGGEAGGIAAVEFALRAMAEGGGIEIEDFRYGGVLHVLVLNFDRARLMKELPGGGPPLPHHRGNDPHLMSLGLGLMEPNGGPIGIPTRPDMWGGGGDLHLPGPPLGVPGAPMFPGGGGPPFIGPRNGPRGMGMLGMPGGGPGLGGVFGSPFQRPPLGPGLHGGLVTKREEEDLDALLNRKSFKEMQQSKTGEELLELLHRPTAKETANAAKVRMDLGASTFVICFLTNLIWLLFGSKLNAREVAGCSCNHCQTSK